MEDRAACPSDSTLEQYLAGDPIDVDRTAVERHSARCAACRYQLVERFEYNRERGISSPTPEDVVQRGLALAPTRPRSFELPPRRVVEPSNRGLKWAIFLVLSAALLALVFVFFPELISRFLTALGF